MDPTQVKLPPLKDLSPENITENTIITNSVGPDLRLRYIISRLVTHLHDFARETRLTTGEWMTGIEFLTAAGKMCTGTRQEFILLSDVLGLSTLVETINHPKPSGATEGTVLGPFHTDDALEFENGGTIASDGKGELCLVRGFIKDTAGKPIVGASIDAWETDSTGHYDTQYADRGGPDCRGIVHSAEDGSFWFKGIKPVSYPVPTDGPVGELLVHMKRHAYRPSHMHFMVKKPGYDTLVTSLFLRGDPYENSDAVFGVKSSLQLDIGSATPDVAKKFDVPVGAHDIAFDFVLVSEKEAKDLKDRLAKEALAKLGSTAKIVEGLPVADVD